MIYVVIGVIKQTTLPRNENYSIEKTIEKDIDIDIDTDIDIDIDIDNPNNYKIVMIFSDP